MGQALYGPHDGFVSYLIVAIVCLSPAIYYRHLWKQEEKSKKAVLENLKTWEWWRE